MGSSDGGWRSNYEGDTKNLVPEATRLVYYRVLLQLRALLLDSPGHSSSRARSHPTSAIGHSPSKNDKSAADSFPSLPGLAPFVGNAGLRGLDCEGPNPEKTDDDMGGSDDRTLGGVDFVG